MKKAKLSPEQAELLLKIADNPLGLPEGSVKDVLDQALHDHLVSKRRKSEVIDETGLEDEINDSLDEIVRIHHDMVSCAFPERLEKGAVAKDVFDSIAQTADVDPELMDDLQQHFVDGKKIELYNDTKRAFMGFGDAFKKITEFRNMLLADENFKDSVNVPAVEKDTEEVMYF